MSRVADALKKAGMMSGDDRTPPSGTLDSFAAQSGRAAAAAEPAPHVPAPHVPAPVAPAPVESNRAPRVAAVAAAPRTPAPVATAPQTEPVSERLLAGPPEPSPAVLKACVDNDLLIVSPRIDPASAHQYRRLASTLHQLQTERQLRSVMITSAVPSEGKTLTAANLALTLSESFRRRVLLVDADLRRPRLHTLFAVDGSQGLSTVLRAGTARIAPIVGISHRLAVLAGGPADHDPVSGLTSDRMRQLIDTAHEMFDWVIVDSPPVGVAADSGFISALVDGVVLVVRASSTPAAVVQRTVAALTPERIIGVVLNRAEKQVVTEYRYYPDRPYVEFDHDTTDESGGRPAVQG